MSWSGQIDEEELVGSFVEDTISLARYDLYHVKGRWEVARQMRDVYFEHHDISSLYSFCSLGGSESFIIK